jgi:hypothetical protein
VLKSDIKDLICSHVKLLAEKLDKHVPSFKMSEYDRLRNPFTSTEIESNLDCFWVSVPKEYPNLA